MSSFLTDHGVLVALVCALCAVAYGLVTARQLLALSPGNEVMQRISGAVQEGARAYLNRQYTVIAGVGVVVFVALIFIQDISVALGFLIGALLSGAAGYVGMNVSVRANARVAEAARSGVGKALDVAFRGGAITGMLVAGLALFGVAGYYGALTGSSTARRRRPSTRSSGSASAARSSRSSPVWAAASSRRPPTSAPTSSARSRPASPRTTRATRPSSPTTWATTSATAPAWPRTSSRPTRSPPSPSCCSAS